MSEHIFYYDNTNTGAPVLNNAAGSLLGVLDACLRTGYNLRSVTGITVAAGVATATAAAHGYADTFAQTILIEGSAQALLNGRKQPLSVATNTFTFAAPGVPDGSYGGSVTARRAPMGWLKPFEATNRAMFRPSAPEASGSLLRVLDTSAAPASGSGARVFMVEAATDVDSFTNRAPTTAQIPDGIWWSKGANNTTPKGWALVGDERFFWLFVELSGTAMGAMQFGDEISYRAADAYPALIGGASSDAPSSGGWNLLGGGGPAVAPASEFAFFARAFDQITVSPVAAPVTLGGSVGGTAGLFPSPVDNGCVIHQPVYIKENNATFSHPIRGEAPGLAAPLANRPFAHRVVVSGLINSPKRFLAINHQGAYGSGQALIDLTGPWRPA